MMDTKIRCYSDLSSLKTFEERFEYLQLGGGVGRVTFGFDRYINQSFYNSREWKDVRRYVLIRDEGCDLGISGFEIHYQPLIHHVNPVRPDDLIHHEAWVLDPEYLVTTTHKTHNAIHFGTGNPEPKVVTERTQGDTKLW